MGSTEVPVMRSAMLIAPALLAILLFAQAGVGQAPEGPETPPPNPSPSPDKSKRDPVLEELLRQHKARAGNVEQVPGPEGPGTQPPPVYVPRFQPVHFPPPPPATYPAFEVSAILTGISLLVSVIIGICKKNS